MLIQDGMEDLRLSLPGQFQSDRDLGRGGRLRRRNPSADRTYRLGLSRARLLCRV